MKKKSIRKWFRQLYHNCIPFWIRNIPSYLYIRYIWRSHVIVTDLKRGQYHDNPEQMLYVNMQILKNFVDVEQPFDRIAWDSTPEAIQAKMDIIEIYDWWKSYPEREKAIWCSMTKDFKDEKRDWRVTYEMERQLIKEEDEMLLKLMNVRHFIST